MPVIATQNMKKHEMYNMMEFQIDNITDYYGDEFTDYYGNNSEDLNFVINNVTLTKTNLENHSCLTFVILFINIKVVK